MMPTEDASTSHADGPPRPHRTVRHRLALVVGILGIAAAVLVPFMPVLAKTTTVTWPQEGRAPASTMALFVPYAPTQVHLDIPCSILRAGQQRTEPTTLVSSHLPGRPTNGFAVTTSGDHVRVLVGGQEIMYAPVPTEECSIALDADASGTTVRLGDQVRAAPHSHVEEIFAFATDLAPQDARGLSVTATTSDWFSNTPSAPKITIIAIQLGLAAGAFVLLRSADRQRRPKKTARLIWLSRLRAGWWPRTVDAAVLAVLGYWIVLGPMTPDDSFATMIARQGWLTGDTSNYYRWENTSEAPFALAHHLLEPFVALSSNPMFLRVPSVLAGLLTWAVLSRGAAPALLPGVSRTWGVRALLAVSFLACWLPFGMGTRPEALTALGSTVALACAVRGATRSGGLVLLGVGVLAAGLTTAASPAGFTSFAPFLVLAPRILRKVRDHPRPIQSTLSTVALLGCAGAVGIVAMFADQSWFGVARATELHQFYGPNVAWFQESMRYENLLGFELQGSIARRVPVLLTLAMLMCTALLLARGAHRLPGMRWSYVAPACWAVDLALLWLTPSKWTHYFGAFAGVGAVALTSSVVLLVAVSRQWRPSHTTVVIGLISTGLCVAVAGVSFAGTNNWFLYSQFGVLWGEQPLRPLNSPLLWLLLVTALVLAPLLRRSSRRSGLPIRMLVRAPAVLTCTVSTALVAILLVSFGVAPLRQQDSYSLGGQNLSRLWDGANCGIMDKLVATPEIPNGALVAAEGDVQHRGFTLDSGYAPDHEPPDAPGTGTSRWLWGSLTGGQLNTGSLTSQWFTLPDVRPDQELAVSVAGRTGDGNALVLEFGRSRADAEPQPVAHHRLDDSYKDSDERATYPTERVLTQKPQDNPNWRTLHLNPRRIPTGANRVRVRATDATTDAGGWLAVTGPRIRSVVPLRQFLQARGHHTKTSYVDWSMTWLFPCVGNLAAVGNGLVQPPRVLFNPPESMEFAGRAAYAKSVGGSFTGVDELGTRREIPTRLVGTEDTPRYEDWGHVEVVEYPIRSNGYDTDTTWQAKWGWQGAPRISPPLAPTSEPP